MSARQALSRALHALCQFINRRSAGHIVTQVFNTVWPCVKHEAGSPYFIVFPKDVLKNSADVPAWRLIWNDHQTQIVSPVLLDRCWKVSIKAVTRNHTTYRDRFVSLWHHLAHIPSYSNSDWHAVIMHANNASSVPINFIDTRLSQSFGGKCYQI